jgi:hypothetical protein
MTSSSSRTTCYEDDDDDWNGEHEHVLLIHRRLRELEMGGVMPLQKTNTFIVETTFFMIEW